MPKQDALPKAAVSFVILILVLILMISVVKKIPDQMSTRARVQPAYSPGNDISPTDYANSIIRNR